MIKLISWLSGWKVWVALAIAALVASGWGYSAFLRHQVSQGQKSIEALSEALRASEANVAELRKARAADEVANRVHTETVKQIEKKEATRRDEIDKAVEANRDWADQPVPSDLAKRLRR